jgi:hypothetical protein
MSAPLRPRANPTDSDTWTVLEHERGGREVWDCEAFGPWELVAGPFTGPTGYALACDALRRLGGAGDGGMTLVARP